MWRNRPSMTAIKVARTLVYIDRDPKLRELLPEGAAHTTERLLLAAGVMPAWMPHLLSQPWMHWVGDQLARWAGGLPAHLALRKRFVETQTRQALSSGTEQILMVGGGFDTLCLRIAAERPECLVVEIDHPNTAILKRRAVDSIAASRPNLHLLSADLSRTSLPDALQNVSAWRSDRSTAVIAEAVLMYLARADVATFFRNAAAVSGVGSRVIFTWARGRDGHPAVAGISALGARLLELIGEPVMWCEPDDDALRAFLSAHGFVYDLDRVRRELAPHDSELGQELSRPTVPELFGVALRAAQIP